jgi:hypothetical protein
MSDMDDPKPPRDTPVPASLAGAHIIEEEAPVIKMPKPPPLPPRARASAAAAKAPVPSADGFMSTQNKMSLADVALALRDEQLEATIVHYKAELQTNSELDAITAHVVEELKSLQRAAKMSSAAPAPVEDKTQVEIELIQSLKVMLQRLFRTDKLASVMERKLAEASKRFARLFFESELHERISGSQSEVKTMRFPEQALYHVLSRGQGNVDESLGAFEYAAPEVRKRAHELYHAFVKELRNDYLARTTPELNALVKMLNDILREFFTRELPPMVGELSWEVVKEARLAEQTRGHGYKLSQAAFPKFRTAFERRFLQRLVPFAEDAMLKRTREGTTTFRAETIRFVADPHIFSAVCELVCDAVYDFLYNDGFLDLPGDWRVRLAAEA